MISSQNNVQKYPTRGHKQVLKDWKAFQSRNRREYVVTLRSDEIDVQLQVTTYLMTLMIVKWLLWSIVRWLLDNCQMIVRWLSDFCQMIVRWPQEFCQMTVWWPSVDQLSICWRFVDCQMICFDCMMNVWLYMIGTGYLHKLKLLNNNKMVRSLEQLDRALKYVSKQSNVINKCSSPVNR